MGKNTKKKIKGSKDSKSKSSKVSKKTVEKSAPVAVSAKTDDWTPCDLRTRDMYRLLDLYFYREFHMYKHLYNSYDKFLDEDIKLFLVNGEHVFSESIHADTIYKNRFKFSNIRYEPPTFDNKVDPIFPSDARHKSLTYNLTLVADVTQLLEKRKIISRDEPEVIQVGEVAKNVQVGYIPLMLRSKYCNLTRNKGVDDKECDYDPGGYFIVNGSEKVVISQDRMVENKPLVFLKKDSSSSSHVVQVNSKSYDPHSLPQSLTIRLRKDNIMTIRVPILQEVNVFALFRALGIESDREIINYTTYNENDRYMMNIVRASLDACKTEKGTKLKSKEEAIDFLVNKIKVIQKMSETSTTTKSEQKKLHLESLLKNNFLPHLSGDLREKAIYLGYMINRLMRVALGRLPLDDRDSYLNKRVDLPGDLMFELFKQQFKKVMNECNKFFTNRTDDENNPYNIIHHIKPNVIEQGLKTALSTGSWIRKKGVAQMMQRLTYTQSIAFLRRVDAPSGDVSSGKLTSPRHLHPSSIAFFCPVQTPEHAKVGLTKHLNLISSITIMDNSTYDAVSNYLMDQAEMQSISSIEPVDMKYMYKVFLNGDWIGVIKGTSDEGKKHSEANIAAMRLYNDMYQKKLTGYFDPEVFSPVIDHDEFEIRVYCDSGRLYRPVLRVGDNNNVLLRKEHVNNVSLNKTHTDKITDWDEFVARHNTLIEYIDMELQPYCMLIDKVKKANQMMEKMKASRSFKFTGHSETDAINRYNENFHLKYTHCEFHPSILLGEIAVNIPYCDSNQGPRNIFQYSQGRQAMGIYATNYRDRTDISYILYHPQKPVVTTRGGKYVNTEILPPGENACVGIATYTGYNQEDSLIFNDRSIRRGMFRSTSLRKFSSSISKNQNTSADDIFTKPDPDKVIGIRHGSYDKLNMDGYVPEETVVHNGDILLAKIKPIQQDIKTNSDKSFKDDSEVYKGHVPGVVDRVYTKIFNQDAYETRKMSVRSERTPQIGDKFCLTDASEVLTTDGWVNIKNITMDHKVATLVDGNKLRYVTPIDTYSFGYIGKMYKLRSQQVDLDVTSDHELYIKKRGHDEFSLVAAENVYGKRVRFKKDCTKGGNDVEHKVINGNNYDMDVYLDLLGIFLADGCIDNDKRIQLCGIKSRKIKHIYDVAKKLNLNIISSKDKDTTHNDEGLGCNHYFYNKDILKDLTPLNVGALNKFIPSWVWDLNQRQSRILLNSLISCDGSHNKQGSECYYTSSRQLADDVMKLAIHAGWSGSVKTIREKGAKWEIKGRKGTINEDTLSVRIIKSKNEPQINHGHTKEQNGQSEEFYDYHGNVYCLEVPSHVFMIRMNGKNVWVGNCSRHGQKGTCGIKLKGTDMCHTRHGLQPDLIVNPNAIPSRMTIGQLIECLIGKVATLQRKEADGTPFEDRDIEAIKDDLEALGYRRDGTEYMYNGMTGEMMRVPIFFGPTYYQRLKHMVQDKTHARARGPRTLLTRQPPEGRSRDGGLRLGEMERDSIAAHGLAFLLKEKLMDNSDAYSTYVCGKCGLFAQRANKRDNKKYPQSTDIYFCKQCENYNDIHKIMIPYAFKLMIQELMSMCIAPRIRVEKPVFNFA